MIKVLRDGEWVDGEPVVGEIIRDYRCVGTSNEHYVQYEYIPIVEEE